MSTLIKRLPLTTAVLAALEAVQVGGQPLRVGNTVIPTGSGWTGQPNATGSKFRGYTVLTTLTAQSSEGSLGDSQGDWWMPYSVQSFGVAPEQAQDIADLVRDAIGGLKGTELDLGDRTYKIGHVRADSLGAVNRIDVPNTPFYGIQDGVSLSLRRQRS